VQDEGYPAFRRVIAEVVPGPLVPLVGAYSRAHFRRQLKARGIGRHALSDIAAMGRRDIDALEALLGDRPWFVADHPTLTDAAVFGQVALFIKSNLPTPVATYARSRPRLVAFVDRMQREIARAPASDADDEEPAPLASVSRLAG